MDVKNPAQDPDPDHVLALVLFLEGLVSLRLIRLLVQDLAVEVVQRRAVEAEVVLAEPFAIAHRF